MTKRDNKCSGFEKTLKGLKKRAYITDRYSELIDFPVSLYPNIKSVESAITKFYGSKGLGERTQKDNKSKTMRFLLYCQDHHWNPNENSYLDAVEVVLKYLRLRNIEYSIGVHGLKNDIFAIKQYYEMMGRSFENPGEDANIDVFMQSLHNNTKYSEKQLNASFIEMETEDVHQNIQANFVNKLELEEKIHQLFCSDPEDVSNDTFSSLTSLDSSYDPPIDFSDPYATFNDGTFDYGTLQIQMYLAKKSNLEWLKIYQLAVSMQYDDLLTTMEKDFLINQ